MKYTWEEFEVYETATFWSNETIYNLIDEPEQGSFNKEQVVELIKYGDDS
jgi:hypothetical protein